MYFQFACSDCGKKLKVRDEKIGSTVRCPYCQHQMLIEAPEEEETPKEDETPNFELDTSGASSTPSSTESSDKAATTSDKSATPELKEKSRSSAAKTPRKPSKQTQTIAHEARADSTEVGTTKSAMIGLVISVLFYIPVGGIFLALGEDDGWYLIDLFCDRGWVPFALVFLMAWSGAILYLKSQKLKRQKRSMLFDLLPSEISEHITAKTSREFMKHIRQLPVTPGESFLINRVLRGLEHFRVLRNNSEVADRLASQSEIDANAVDSSYTVLKVFIWAIPILGFIGTVIGISAAVGGFDSGMADASSVEAMKASLGNVTGGLSTAFDTTLVALVMSMFVMFPTSAMQKSEEDLLNWVDEYCNENLLKRLKDVNRNTTAGISDNERKAMLGAIDAAMSGHHAELKNWSKKLEEIGSTITRDVSTGWKEIDQQVQATHQQNLQKLNEAAIANVTRQEDVVEKVQQAQQQITESQNGQAEKLGHIVQSVQDQTSSLEQASGSAVELLTSQQESMQQIVQQFEQAMNLLADKSESVHADSANAMSQSAESLNAYFTQLQTGLESLNRVLGDLGEKQVVVEAHVVEQPRKRGWGIFSRNN